VKIRSAFGGVGTAAAGMAGKDLFEQVAECGRAMTFGRPGEIKPGESVRG
jgi:hypothetical protein